ncbi:MAG: hypothetical protein PHC38_10560 [Weeksellaceae bacterium]|nr:hypothetical protein [Weeksellaceae bacterium]
MEINNYENQKALLKKQFTKLGLSEFSRFENQFYETLMDSNVFSNFRTAKEHPPTIEIMSKLSQSESPITKLVYLICSTIFCGIDENITIYQIRKDLYESLHEIDLEKLSYEFLLGNELENSAKTSLICNLIECLQTTHSCQIEKSPEEMLKLKIKQEFRKENEDSYPLAMVENNPFFQKFDDLLLKENDKMLLSHINGLIINFEEIDSDLYGKYDDIVQELAELYKGFKVTLMVVAIRFSSEIPQRRRGNFLTPKLDLREIELNVNLEDFSRSNAMRILNRIDL